MNQIRTRILVGPDHRITGTAPEGVPPGEHEVMLTVLAPLRRRFGVKNMPFHHELWDDNVSLRREDMYGDDGR